MKYPLSKAPMCGFDQYVDSSFDNIREVAAHSESIDKIAENIDRLVDTSEFEDRLNSLEQSVSGNSRFLPWQYNAEGGEQQLEPPYNFTSARLFINGVRQRAGAMGSYYINNKIIRLAEPLEEGDWVDVELGTEPLDVGDADVVALKVNNLHTKREAIEWREGLKVTDPLQLYIHEGVEYLPNIDDVPFKTGASFNASNWVSSALVTNKSLLKSMFDIRGWGGKGDALISQPTQLSRAINPLIDDVVNPNATDNSVAVNKMLAEGVPYILFPEGFFGFKSTITANYNVGIKGFGVRSVLYPLTNAPVWHWIGADNPREYMIGINVDNIAVSHIGVNQDKSHAFIIENAIGNTFNLIYAKKCSRVFVQAGVWRSTFTNMFDMNFQPLDFNDYWFYADAASSEYNYKKDADNTYERLIAQANKMHFYLAGENGKPQDGINILDCILFKGNSGGSDNIYIKEGYWLNINDNKIFEPSRHGVHLVDCAHVTANDNVIAWAGQDTLGHGIYCTSTKVTDGLNVDINISGNVVVGSSGANIYLDNAHDFNISTNTAPNPNSETRRYRPQPLTYSGIMVVGNSSNGVINGNTIGRKLAKDTAYQSDRKYLHDIYIQEGCSSISVNHNLPEEVCNEGSNNSVSNPLPFNGEIGGTFVGDSYINRLSKQVDGWLVQGYGVSAPTVTKNTPGIYANDAVTLSIPATLSGQQSWYMGESSSPFYQGNTAIFSIWMRSDTPCVITLSLFGEDNVETRNQYAVRVDTEWRRYYYYYTIPKNFNKLFVRIGSNAGASKVSLQILNAKLEKGCGSCLPSDYHITMRVFGSGFIPSGLWSKGDRVQVTVPTEYSELIYDGDNWKKVAISSLS